MRVIKHWMFFLAFLTWGNCHAAPMPDIDTHSLQSSIRFTTWQGIEPDKWATIWLIKRYLSPNAYFIFLPPNTDLPADAYAFDVPGALLKRANRESMFRRLKKSMDQDTQTLEYLDAIIHDIEVNIWDANAHPHATWFETMFRQLQARYDRDKVPVDCYLAFFDGVARLSAQPDIQADDYSKQLSLASRCPGVRKNKDAYIEQFSHEDILREISLGKKVVFVDTREDEEYDEVHLPGAQILRLRDVSEESVKTYMDADLVVPYCVKDFRGFEVAKSMKRLGVNRVATLSPNGLKGWLQASLPVAHGVAASDQEAVDALMRCSMEPSTCLKGGQVQ